MSDATARYVIAADDRTKAAIASVRNSFKSLESGVRSSVRLMNFSLGILAGVGLKRTFQNVLDVTSKSAEGQRGFAQSLAEVRDAAHNLLGAKTGLPGATAAMKELASTLNDPSVRAAADAITSGMIRGFSTTAKFVALTVTQIRNLGVALGLFKATTRTEVFDSLGREIERLQSARQSLLEATRTHQFIKGEPQQLLDQDQGGRMGALDEQIRLLERRRELLSDHTADRGGARNMAAIAQSRTQALAEIASARASNYFTAQREFEILGKEFDDLVKQSSDWTKMRKDQFDDLADKTRKDMAERIEAEFAVRKEFGQTLEGRLKAEQELREFRAKQESDAVEEWKSMWRGAFETWVRGGQRNARALAQAILAELGNKAIQNAIDAISGALSGSGGKGGGGWLGSILGVIGGLLGGGGTGGTAGARALGGPVMAGRGYLVGERGPELFLPRRSGEIIPNGGGSRGAVTINNTVTVVGAGSQVTRAEIAESMQRTSDVTIARIRDLHRRGRF